MTHVIVLTVRGNHAMDVHTKQRRDNVTRELLNRAKRKLARCKPVMDTDDYELYQSEMAAWDSKLEHLKGLETQLEKKEVFEEMELLGKMGNLEKRRNNRLQMIEVLKQKYLKIGMRINRATDFKLRQLEIVDGIVAMEVEIEEYSKEIEAILIKQLAKL